MDNVDNVQSETSEGESQTEAPLTSEGLTKILTDFKNDIDRKLQSTTDKLTDKVKKVGQPSVAGVTQITQQNLSHLDPEVAREVQIEVARMQQEANAVAGQEQRRTQAADDFDDSFVASLQKLAKQMGIKEDDPKLVWGDSKQDYLLRLNAFNESLVSAQQGTTLDTAKLVKEEVAKAEAEWRKTEGLPPKIAPATDAAVNTTDDSDAAFIARWNAGDEVSTKEAIARVEKINSNQDKLIQ